MPTIKDIAEQAGVSISTVSLVLNGRNCRVSDATRELVLHTAARLHYRPNRLAVGLATRRTMTLGIILPDIGNLFFSELAKGISERAQAHGYSIMICNTEDDPEKDIKYARILSDSGVEGVVLCMSSCCDEQAQKELSQELRSRGIPMVAVDRLPEGGNSCTVAIRYRKGGYLATRHLTGLGHRCIGCITGPLLGKNARERLDGYRDALCEADLPLDESLVFEGDYHRKSGACGAEALLRYGATAIFCSNDLMAYGAYETARQIGLHVPENLSVVGFDDILFSQMLEVPLTTIRQPALEMGRAAVMLLLQKIEDPDRPVEPCWFEPELMIRKSTAAPNL